MKFCVASGVKTLLAVMVIGKLPAAPGVPARVAVPLPLSVNVTPLGSAPVLLRLAVGVAVVVTVNVSGAPNANVVLFALVNVGAVTAGVE